MTRSSAGPSRILLPAVLVMLFVLSPLRFAPPPPAAGIESAVSSR
ncbi:hypothetical protein [Microbacterium shaanxiense]